MTPVLNPSLAITPAWSEISSNLNIPYIITEYGPVGPWDAKKDINGRPHEPLDRSKGHSYKILYRAIQTHKGYALGGFAFLLGDTTQNSFTWWNLTYQNYKKFSYLVMQEFYTGKKFTQKIPHINRIITSKRKHLQPKELFNVEVQLQETDLPDLKYQYFASTDIKHMQQEYPNKKVALSVIGEGPSVQIQAPSYPGVYRLYAIVTDANNNASTLSKTIRVGY